MVKENVTFQGQFLLLNFGGVLPVEIDTHNSAKFQETILSKPLLFDNYPLVHGNKIRDLLKMYLPLRIGGFQWPC